MDTLSDQTEIQDGRINNLTSLIPTGGINPKLCSYHEAGPNRNPGQSLYNLNTNWVPNYDRDEYLKVGAAINMIPVLHAN